MTSRRSTGSWLGAAVIILAVYAVNAVAYKGCRVEIAGFRSNTAPKLIDVADYFIDLGEIADRVRKDVVQGARYDERELLEQQPAHYLHEHIHLQETHQDEFETAMHVLVETTLERDEAEFADGAEFIRVTDEH